MFDNQKTLRRMEAKQDAILRGILMLSQASGLIIKLERQDIMATAENLARLQDQVSKNTDAVKSAEAALTGFQTTVADLTQKLQDAIANGDDDAVKAAADALEANNNELTAAIPATAQAVVANTPAA